MLKNDHLADDRGSLPVPDLALEQKDGPDLLPNGFADPNPERDPLVASLEKDGWQEDCLFQCFAKELRLAESGKVPDDWSERHGHQLAV